MKDVLRKWDVGYSIKNTFVEKFFDDYDGKTILLKGKNESSPTIKVFFEDAISYRNTDESFLIKIWNDTPSEILGHTFYIINHSTFIDSFHELTYGLYKNWEITHYAFYTNQDCIDVLSHFPPSISIVKN